MNKFQIQLVYPQSVVGRGFLMLALSAIVLLSGCRQPVTNQAGRSNIFDFSRPRLFGGNSQTNSQGINQGSDSRYAYNPGQQRPYSGNGDLSGLAAQQQYAGISNEVQRLNQRLGAYDSDNQLLNTEVAGLKQKLQLANQYNQTLKDQLGDTSSRIQIAELEKQTALQQMATLQGQVEHLRTAQQQADTRAARYASSAAALQSSSQNRLASFNNGSGSSYSGGATIRANNSLMQQLNNISIPGGQARMDGDVIRVEFPTDRMFVPGTYQIQPSQLPVLQNIAATIRQNFTKQIVGIEAHWDGTPLNPSTTTDHQLTATQALAVFDNLVRLGLPKSQLFTMAMASNRPRHPRGPSGGVNPNRRIELVIYPESYDGS